MIMAKYINYFDNTTNLSCLYYQLTSIFHLSFTPLVMKKLELEDIITRIGKRIKALRAEQNITQEELAVKSDIDVRSIQRLENGHTSATLKTLLKVSHGLDTSLVFLLDVLNEKKD